MERTVAEKMGLVPGSRAFVKNAPGDWLRELHRLEMEVKDRLTGKFPYLHLFAMDQKSLTMEFPKFAKHLDPAGKFWVSWPKAGKLGTDLNMKEVIRIGYACGLVESKMLRIDETWTALKFTHPVPGKTYRNSFGELPSG